MVMVIVAILSAIAFPSLKTFSGRTADVGEATMVARVINEARSMARRRNRAYVVQLAAFSDGRPTGSLIVREGVSGSCIAVTSDLGNKSRQVGLTKVFGDTLRDNRTSEEERVGLRGWMAPDKDFGDRRTGDLTLCLSPDGSASMLTGAQTATPIGDRVGVLIQKHKGSPGQWAIDGPPRVVEITFSGGAQLELK